MPNSVTVNRPITRNRVCTKPGTVHRAEERVMCARPMGLTIGMAGARVFPRSL